MSRSKWKEIDRNILQSGANRHYSTIHPNDDYFLECRYNFHCIGFWSTCQPLRSSVSPLQITLFVFLFNFWCNEKAAIQHRLLQYPYVHSGRNHHRASFVVLPVRACIWYGNYWASPRTVNFNSIKYCHSFIRASVKAWDERNVLLAHKRKLRQYRKICQNWLFRNVHHLARMVCVWIPNIDEWLSWC